jgi:DNA replication protein DnaC
VVTPSGPQKFFCGPSGDKKQTKKEKRKMLQNQTYDLLVKLKLSGMAAAFAQQLEQPETNQLSFEERFALLVDREITSRDTRRLQRLLQLARLRQSASIEDIDYKHKRGLERGQMVQLTTCDFVRRHQNLHITGPTGTGKSWIACALGHQAARQGHVVKYERVGGLLETLRIARGDGSYQKRLLQLGKVELLILDDFGLKPLTQSERHDLLEVVEERHARRSTLITSQLPIGRWHDYLSEDPTVADALLDRLLSGAHRLELNGESMRRVKSESTA